jgi:Flp pilus assembly pilin Flp
MDEWRIRLFTRITRSISIILNQLLLSEQGQDLTEYAFLVAMIAVIVVIALVFFGTEVSTFYSTLGASAASWLS